LLACRHDWIFRGMAPGSTGFNSAAWEPGSSTTEPPPMPQQQEAMSTTKLGKTLPTFPVDTPATAVAAKVTGNLAEIAEPDDWTSSTRAYIEAPASANTNRLERVALVAEAPQAPAQTHDAAAALREAWQQPAFSYETIKRDAWTAVYLAAPEAASQPLLAAAYDVAARIPQGIGARISAQTTAQLVLALLTRNLKPSRAAPSKTV